MERTQRLKKILIENQDNFDVDENGCIQTKTPVMIKKTEILEQRFQRKFKNRQENS